MHAHRFLPFCLLSLTPVLRAASAPVAPEDHESVVKLESLVVTAGPGERTAFDLAQNAAILSAEELRHHNQPTLGETLTSVPGVNSTYHGPGASRPIIRGLGGDRIRVLANGIGALDASSVSPDHTTAVEPLFASRIEVLRGPATLLYGSSAVGGVVNVIDNRIPGFAGDGLVHGAIELRGAGPANERAAVAALSAGNPRVAVQVNALRRRTDDLDIPGVARIDAAAPADQPSGTLPGSGTDTWSGSVGAAWFGQAGRIGAAMQSFETVYGVPAGDEPVAINLKQKRVDLQADLGRSFAIFTGARARLGFGDYNHAEVVDGDQVNTVFVNRTAEGRIELPHSDGCGLSGTLGVQAARADFSARGEEVVTPPSLTQSAALFAIEELKHGAVTWQAGARYERQSIRLGEVDPNLPPVPGYAARSHERRTAEGVSGSVGAVWYLAPDWSLGTALAASERLPTAQELFSNGPHGGTGTYEVGTSHLGNERSVGIDVSLRRRAGRVTGTLSVFANRFRNFVFEHALPADAIPPEHNEEGLAPYQFDARDAEFLGGEAEITVHLLEGPGYHLHLELMSDCVRARQTTDHAPLPRIPPLRYGAGLHFENAHWNVGLDARRTASQHRITTAETATPGYTLVQANAGYVIDRGRMGYEFFVRGSNLLDAEARVHSSFLKAFAPLPGRGLLAGVRCTF